jgi:uncharacterized protein YktB (UPF0637 family)
MKTVYQLNEDAYYSTIKKIQTTSEPNGYTTFATFKEAKAELLWKLKLSAEHYAQAVKRVRSFKKSEVLTGRED